MRWIPLCELIEELEKLPPEFVIEKGFAEPHSDRGYYEDLAFDPAELVTVESMLKHAKSALGATFTGWKGGKFTMHETTVCRIGYEGSVGDVITSYTITDWKDELAFACPDV